MQIVTRARPGNCVFTKEEQEVIGEGLKRVKTVTGNEQTHSWHKCAQS